MTGIGTTKVTKETRTTTTNSSANIFPKSRKLSDKGMNGISNALNGLYDISGVEVGQHFYWQIAGFQVYAQVLITSWVVIAILLGSAVIAVRNLFQPPLKFLRICS
ncbi:hypothetical protein PVK06_037112 [Gossypium arboreum]|uniref:Uncharacterized protein n=1 Tax=Gossypium arboreum TaxID=29729 RepID=A0ABR0MYG6_GOSAR|nr:hypothetical protein PVK06_037112 [Gossypium arboreum]